MSPTSWEQQGDKHGSFSEHMAGPNSPLAALPLLQDSGVHVPGIQVLSYCLIMCTHQPLAECLHRQNIPVAETSGSAAQGERQDGLGELVFYPGPVRETLLRHATKFTLHQRPTLLYTFGVS